MDLYNYLRLIRRQWWIVLITVMVALGAGAFVTVRAQPRYAATVTFFVTTASDRITDAYQGGLFLQQRVKSYADLLASDRLAQAVANQNPVGMTADEIRSRISTSTETGTVLLRATVVDSEPARALRLTEALAARFVDLVRQIETPAAGQNPMVKIEVISGPRVGTVPVSPRPVRNLSLAALLGLVAGVAVSVLRGLIDTRMRDGRSLQQATGAPLLGEIPFEAAARTAPLIVGDAARSLRAEAIRKLRTNLRFVDVHEAARVISVSSAVQGEGKTTTACNLAIALAEAGWRVLLVDADLRRPKVAEYLGVESAVGLTDVLLGDVQVGDVVQPWGDRSLLVLPAGSTPPNPSELLGSKAMADVLAEVRESADIVIIDTPPLLAVTDAVVVAVQADGALLVAQHGRTSVSQAAAAAGALHAVSVRLLGCVLNMSRATRADSDQYEAYRVVTARVEATVPADRASTAGRAAVGQRVAVDPTQELTRLPR
ncbi:polysaccharide biosynthesis tyrosine autokinase [Micromonospora echinofusca]|uniref:Polysaccharide biosynthesis tyrosine autokinase n=1 Tax=Micromonospora echinofusca TaxID=47858 RepID=A0ABS3VX32_MICEH|nr:polysaccharide biosynthesis tyrosine autokinase [Micromonospora echinofusca]MBO4209095.1 polysaccharide biosynthesis tyrosine autokinase [Micromonospora echinofusca]